jgi:D-amino peptidase
MSTVNDNDKECIVIKKLYVSADIEGICGIADWKETNLTEGQGEYFRAEMTREVAAACEAANASGISEILVKDAHGTGRSIDPSRLPENVRLMRAWTGNPLSMMAGIDDTFGAAFYIGYHSGGGTDGNPLAHTMDTTNVQLFINGDIASEFLINAWTAASYGVPSLLLTGDKLLCGGAPAIAPGIRTVAVNEGVGGASISINPSLAGRLIREATAAALAAPPPPLVLPKRFSIKILYRSHDLAHKASWFPGVKQTAPLEVSFKTREWFEVIRTLYFIL